MDEVLALYLATHMDAVLKIDNDSETVFVELTDCGKMVFRGGVPLGPPGYNTEEQRVVEGIGALITAAALTVVNDVP